LFANEDLEKKVQDRTKNIVKSQKQLESHIADLEKFKKYAVGRELRMIELQKNIKQLKRKG